MGSSRAPLYENYTVSPPHYIDLKVRCTAHGPELFGKRGYAILFFASYMNNVGECRFTFEVNKHGVKIDWAEPIEPHLQLGRTIFGVRGPMM